MVDYLVFFAIVLGVNLLPALGPPTWSIIVLYGLNTRLPVPALVLTGALAAASGRFLLAHAFRLLASRLPHRTRRNLTAAREALLRRKRNAVLGLALFAISPLPSAQLFEAAGLAKVRLLPFTAAFFAGRVVSYSLYAVSAQHLRETSLGEVVRRNLTSPFGIALQLAMLGGLVALSQLDWGRYFKRPAP
jgi:uncharacterized membrane protein YdjX (TVP38/TMEM64 family)